MHPLARLIDANANRAREALRMMEDLARFALDDAALSADLKALRHDLRAALDALAERGLDRGMLLASRDTEHDVGTTTSTEAETRRDSPRDLALAAGARLSESLRALDEATKLVPPTASGATGVPSSARPCPPSQFESLRYRAYTAEQRLALALTTGRCPQWPLCLLLTESLCARPWLEVATAAIDAGAACLQLREKGLPDRELLARARRLVELAGPRGVSVIINDRPEIALLAGADGVHLGQSDIPIHDARRLAGDRLLIGLSAANADQARAAIRAGADYCGLGPMFPTTTKHKPTLAGPALIRDYLADPILAQRTHLAIGGITPGNAPALAAAGCKGVAVSSAVCSARDPAAVCRALLAALG
ncbi:MAG: thiamine phosphate synthase [Phycisphaerales bacterium]